MIKGLPESYIESLGYQPLFMHYFGEGKKYESKGNYKEAIRQYKEILNYCPSLDDNKVSAYDLIGMCYFNLNEIQDAMLNFNKALDYVEKIKDKKPKSILEALNYYYLGCCYFELKKWEDALKYFEDSLKESIRLNNDSQRAYTLIKIASIYLELNNVETFIKKILQSIQDE